MIRPLKPLMLAMAVSCLLIAPAQARDFRSSDVHPDDYPTVQAVKYMGELLKKRSQGKFGIKVYPNSQLGSEKDAIEQTKLGALDLIRVHSAPLNAICPATMLPTMPFLFRNKEHLRHVLDGAIGDEILKACESQGMVGLAFYDSGARSFYTVKKPIKSLADMKGLKIRVPQSELWVAVVQAMGANATPMPYGEVYTALKTGLVDGAENNTPSYEASRQFEVAPYFALTEHSMAPDVLLMSKRIFDSLSADEQKMVRQAAKESVPYMRKLWDEREARARATVEKGGARFSDPNNAEFAAAMAPVYDKFIQDPKLKALLTRIQQTK